MRKILKFRPSATERLEDRSVPTGFGGVNLGGFLGSIVPGGPRSGGLVATVPAQDARDVASAFAAFDRTYDADVKSILMPSGAAATAATRAAFDAAIAAALGTLETSIDAAIADLPAAATLDATIHDQLLGTGTGSTSLQAQLLAIPPPTTTGNRAAGSFQRSGDFAIGQVASTVVNEVRSADPPVGTIDPAVVQADLQAISTAYRTFAKSYDTAVRSVLLATGTTPAAQRAAFDAAVQAALTTLQSSVTSAVSNLPTAVSTPLAATLTADLTGTPAAGTSLAANLAALSTPASATGFAPTLFRFGSSLAIGGSQGRVTYDVISAVNAANSSLG